MDNQTLDNLKKAAIVLNELSKSFKDNETKQETKNCVRAIMLAVKEIEDGK